MFKLGSLFFEVSAKSDAYEHTLAKAEVSAEQTGKRIAEATQFKVGEGSSIAAPKMDLANAVDSSAIIAEISALAPRIGSEFRSALIPLQTFLQSFGTQFDVLAGTMVTFARRIDASMKFPGTQAALRKLQGLLEDLSNNAMVRAVDSGQRVTYAFAGITAAAAATVGAVRQFRVFNNVFSSMGDVAGKGLSKIVSGVTSVVASATGLKKTATGVTAIGAAAEKAAAPIKNMGVQIIGALGLVGVIYKATQAIVRFFSSGIKGSTDLAESQSALKEVFGASAAGIMAQTDQLSAKFGLSKQAMLDAASGFGAMAQGAGLTREASAKLSVDMVKLAADLGSLKNISLDEALQKIQSGLAGESEPLRKFGVMVTEAGVANEAMRLGLSKSGKDLDEHAKLMARASLITKGLATASGDLERTQDGTANKMRIFQGRVENLAIAFGDALAPATNKGITVLVEFATYLASTFEANKESIAAFGKGLAETFESVAGYMRNLPLVWDLAWLSIQQGVLNMQEWFGMIPINLASIANYIEDNWLKIITDSVNRASSVFMNFGDNLRRLFFALQDAIMGKGFQFNWKPLLDGFEATAAKLPELIKPHLTDMSEEIAAAANKLQGKITKDAEAAKPKPDAEKKAAVPAPIRLDQEKHDWVDQALGFTAFQMKQQREQNEKQKKIYDKVLAMPGADQAGNRGAALGPEAFLKEQQKREAEQDRKKDEQMRDWLRKHPAGRHDAAMGPQAYKEQQEREAKEKKDKEEGKSKEWKPETSSLVEFSRKLSGAGKDDAAKAQLKAINDGNKTLKNIDKKIGTVGKARLA